VISPKFWERNASHFKQAFRTGAAALLSLYLTKALGLSQGYWAAISSIIVLQSHMGATVKASSGRLIATAIGAAVGALMIGIEGNAYLSVAVAISVAVLCCTPQRLRDSYRLAGSTVISVMLGTRSASPWATALERFLEVSIGIMVALVVAKVLWPSRARHQLRMELQQGYSAAYMVFKAVIDRYKSGTRPDIEDLLSKVRDTRRQIHEIRQQASYEHADAGFSDELIAATIGQLRLIRQGVDGMELATRAIIDQKLEQAANPEVEQLLNSTSIAFDRVATVPWGPDADPGFFNVEEPLSALDHKLATKGFSDVASQCTSDDVMRFHAFILSLRSVAQELALTGQLLGKER
jgi:uncharacterized membrane protein YccC